MNCSQWILFNELIGSQLSWPKDLLNKPLKSFIRSPEIPFCEFGLKHISKPL